MNEGVELMRDECSGGDDLVRLLELEYEPAVADQLNELVSRTILGNHVHGEVLRLLVGRHRDG